MKILLTACNAKYIHSNLAVYNLRAYAREFQDHIFLKEYTINQEKDQVLGDLYEERPDVVCISCYIWNISYVRELLHSLHQVLPQTKLWVGGPEVTYDAAVFLKENPWVTGVMRGEGEATFRELAVYYVTGQGQLSQIEGLTYLEQGQIRENPWREILDLSTVPFAYEDLTDFQNRIIYYESSRGCPFSCSYCLSSVDKKLRFRDLALVKKELQFFLDQRVPQVKFVDRTFNCKKSHALEIWTYLLEHDTGCTNFHFEVAADLLDEEEMELISRMRPGLIQLEIGVQSTNPETIAEIQRVMDFSKVAATVRQIRSLNRVHQHLDLIAGLPYENYESFGRSFDQVYALQPDQLQLGFLKVLKGSYMYEQAKTYDCRYHRREPYEILGTKWLSYEDILKLKMVESVVEVYYNSGQFQNSIELLLGFFDRPFALYEALGTFYRRKDLDKVSHSRLRRYDILLEFLEEAVPDGPIEVLKERMLMDLYLRENLKSRPWWAADERQWSRAAKEYIRSHDLPKTSHIEIFSEKTILFDYERRDPLHHNAQVREISLLAQTKGEDGGTKDDQTNKRNSGFAG